MAKPAAREIDALGPFDDLSKLLGRHSFSIVLAAFMTYGHVLTKWMSAARRSWRKNRRYKTTHPQLGGSDPSRSTQLHRLPCPTQGDR
ncbi:hypothetical protein BDZ85DRAFT_91671 [Elsinoe ampelina]|uniref:Uncharacterized protein n=1 Tax=Elsinoe ampelina TaxID=302913 RepID=A0A6A6GHV0_9PEZI|nr:hypothetical protein BDZ85DRAFT_91671 [Elsinoe ampelina]